MSRFPSATSRAIVSHYQRIEAVHHEALSQSRQEYWIQIGANEVEWPQ